jgi:hypothetical protein
VENKTAKLYYRKSKEQLVGSTRNVENSSSKRKVKNSWPILYRKEQHSCHILQKKGEQLSKWEGKVESSWLVLLEKSFRTIKDKLQRRTFSDT